MGRRKEKGVFVGMVVGTGGNMSIRQQQDGALCVFSGRFLCFACLDGLRL